MSLKFFRCKIDGCGFKTEKKDEKLWDCHYRDEHGIRITNQCRNCREIFVALKDVGDGEEVEFKSEVICDECRSKVGIEFRNGRVCATEYLGFWSESKTSVLESLILKEPEKV